MDRSCAVLKRGAIRGLPLRNQIKPALMSRDRFSLYHNGLKQNLMAGFSSFYL